MTISPHSFAVTLCIVLAALGTPRVRADERDDKIRALEQRIEHLEKLLQQQGLMPATQQPSPAPKPVPAQPSAPETKPAPDATPTAEAKPVASPSLSVGASGFTVRSADADFVLRLRGLLQVDYHQFLGDGAIEGTDTFLLRRARPIIEGTVFRDFDFRFTPDFGGSSAKIQDAYLNYRLSPALQLRVGKQKVPLSLERWQSIANAKFVERSLPSSLMPSRGLGVTLHGEFWPGEETVTKSLGWDGLVSYAVGVFNTVADAQSAPNADFSDDKMFGARVFVHPFLKTQVAPLRSFGLGVAGTYGRAEGRQAMPPGLEYGTETDQSFLFYTNGVVADGAQWRFVPQAYYYLGPFGLLGEYVITSPEVQIENSTAPTTRLYHTGWAVTASWLMTGERSGFGRINPRRNFDPPKGGWGAWELVGRYSRFNIDGDSFPTYADPSTSASRISTWGVGLNWYLNRNVRLDLNYLHLDFDGDAGSDFAGEDENLFLSRVQLSF